MTRGGENRRPGFSLVELLVAMVILAVLGCLVHAGYTSSREMAQQTQCASNLRQLGAGLLLYCQAHNGQFPKTRHDAAASESWVYTLAPYTGDVDAIRICPGDPRADKRLEAGLSSYVMNEYVAVVNQDYDFATGSFVVMEDYTNLMRLPRPAETITVFTGADDLPVNLSYDHTHSRSWVGANAYAYARQDIQPDRHRGGANYLYADAHVDFMTAPELRAIFARGVNPAKPPL
jgi:prepilin-type N-terminal cleavage/methylation domain-containing protein/prepilin-type processing-associated H-X9-DG protein